MIQKLYIQSTPFHFIPSKFKVSYSLTCTNIFTYRYGTFASGGSDCVVNIWDGAHRKRIKHINGYPDEIASLAFSADGSKLAIASSYTFDEGERDHAPDAIFVKTIVDQDVAPRVVT